MLLNLHNNELRISCCVMYKVTIAGGEHLVLCFKYIKNIRRSVYHAVFGTKSPLQEVCHSL